MASRMVDYAVSDLEGEIESRAPGVLGPRWKGHLVKGPRPKDVNRELFKKASVTTENR